MAVSQNPVLPVNVPKMNSFCWDVNPFLLIIGIDHAHEIPALALESASFGIPWQRIPLFARRGGFESE